MQCSIFSDHLILPKNETTVLVKIAGREIAPVRNLPIIARTRRVISDDGVIAFIAAGGRRISFMKLDDGTGIRQQPSVLLPPKCCAQAIIFHGNILYVGGNRGIEILGCINCADKPLSFQHIPLPGDIPMAGKAIDDLLVDGDRLIAVDNMVWPKYLLAYDISNPVVPVFQHKFPLTNNGTCEKIIKAVMSDHHIAILSASIGQCGSGKHIVILDRRGYAEVNVMRSFARAGLPANRRQDADPMFLDIAFRSNELVIAWGQKGVSVVHDVTARLPDSVPDEPYFPGDLSIGSIGELFTTKDQGFVVCANRTPGGFEYFVL